MHGTRMWRFGIALTALAAMGVASPGAGGPVNRWPWMRAWACPSFKGMYELGAVPHARNSHPADLVGVPPGLDARLDFRDHGLTPTIAYDAAHRLAYAVDEMGSPWIERAPDIPRFPVIRADLSRIRLASGITIGTPASTVVAIMGKPRIQRGCSRELFTYATGRGHDSVFMTIQSGRVVAMFFFGDD